MIQDLELVKFDAKLLQRIWEIGFRDDKPAWKEWDGPYFDDYRKSDHFDDFLTSYGSFYLSDQVRCILFQGQALGMVSRYWKDERTYWLEIGITIFSDQNWSQGIGTQALSLWLSQTFEAYPELQHIGLTTWSGNHRMMRAAEKSGMQKEAQIRRVRYHLGHYYDSVSYGILREEWEQIEAQPQ